MTEAVRRVLSSLVLAPLLMGVLFWAPPAAFTLLVTLATFLACVEWYGIHGRRAVDWIAAAPLLAALPTGLGWAGEAVWGVWLAGTLGGLTIASLTRREAPEARLAWAEQGAGAAFFVAVPLAHLVLLRNLAGGTRVILFLLLVVWVVDTAAWFFGVRFGRHRMSPVLSPKKSWEGLIAGLSGGVAAAAALGPTLLGVSPAASAVVGLAVGALGQTGDLFESLWKRAHGVKDSGHLIPGHGGLLDRVDSLLLSGPALYWILRLRGMP
jgi:phosphatidate cytidylyltransferase